jgi:hypothetical protein
MTRKKIIQFLVANSLTHIYFMGTYFSVQIEYDKKAYKYMKSKARLYLQIWYNARCIKTGKYELWHGRKWYLSDYMTEDEIVKTAFAAFKATVEHEVMETFKVKGKPVFNPHIDFKELLKISDKEVTRKPKR